MSFDHKHRVLALAQVLAVAALAAIGAGAYAAGADLGQATKQATNWTAIGMFGIFVAATLGITKWAAAKTKSAADFYTAGGGISGFQNGLAIAGDYMSAATLLAPSTPGARAGCSPGIAGRCPSSSGRCPGAAGPSAASSRP